MGLAVVGIGFKGMLDGVARSVELILFFVPLGELLPVQRAVLIQPNGTLVFLPGPLNVEVRRGRVVNLSQDEVIAIQAIGGGGAKNVAGVVAIRALVDGSVVLEFAGNPRGEEDPPGVVNQRAGRNEDQNNGDKLPQPGIELQFPIDDEGIRQIVISSLPAPTSIPAPVRRIPRAGE
jgi:hypothetical protein